MSDFLRPTACLPGQSHFFFLSEDSDLVFKTFCQNFLFKSWSSLWLDVSCFVRKACFDLCSLQSKLISHCFGHPFWLHIRERHRSVFAGDNFFRKILICMKFNHFSKQKGMIKARSNDRWAKRSGIQKETGSGRTEKGDQKMGVIRICIWMRIQTEWKRDQFHLVQLRLQSYLAKKADRNGWWRIGKAGWNSCEILCVSLYWPRKGWQDDNVIEAG